MIRTAQIIFIEIKRFHVSISVQFYYESTYHFTHVNDELGGVYVVIFENKI